MEALIEIIIEGVKKFGGEIIAAIFLAIALGLFPSQSGSKSRPISASTAV